VLRPALICATPAPSPQCDWLTEKDRLRAPDRAHLQPGLPNFTVTKILWVKQHQPEIFAKIRHIMSPKDYVVYRLTGEFAIDVQEASGTLLLDVTHRRLSKKSAEAAGIDESWLPKSIVAGSLRAHQRDRRRTHRFASGTPVVAGAAIRARARWAWDSSAGLSLGHHRTSGVVFAATAAPTKAHGRLHTFCHAVPGLWM